MPRTLLLVLFSCAMLSAKAQTYYFPKTLYADSVALQQQLPALAAKVAASMEAKGNVSNLRNLARLYLLAGNDAKFKYWLDSFVVVNVGPLKENPEISSANPEDDLKKRADSENDTGLLWFGIGLTIVGLLGFIYIVRKFLGK